MAPLWEMLKDLVPEEPRPKAKPYLWDYDDVRKHLLEAGDLVTAEEAERRVLVLANPGYDGQARATAMVYAGIQLVLPGEVAPAHRHTQSALRFVLESEGGFTAVNGERTRMAPGDLVITPSWTWHDHGNASDKPVTWVDILDVPMVNFFEAGFYEHYNDKSQEIVRPEGDSLARYGLAMLPVDAKSPFGATSPIFNYPFERTREALAAMVQEGSLDPHWGATLLYSNPIDGGWPMPTIASWMTHLPSGTSTNRMRSTDGVIVVVAEGRGVARIGDQRLPFKRHDVFVVPNWMWRSFEADEDCFLFCSSDRSIQQKMDVWREDKAQS